MIHIRQVFDSDVDAVVSLQSLCFPPPFPYEILWREEYIREHIQVFPAGQFVAVSESRIVGSCSNLIISESTWRAHQNWDLTVGGPFLSNHDDLGSTLYGVDISVHPDFRGIGIGRRLYQERYELVRRMSLRRFATACRIPDFAASRISEVGDFVRQVLEGSKVDRTLSPLLRYGLCVDRVLHEHMEDAESANYAVSLIWNSL